MTTRVLHVFGVMDPGGAEVRTLELVRATRGVVIHEFATLEARAGALDAEIVALGGQVHPCPLGLDFPRRFLALCRRRRPDVVHAHVYLASGLPLAIAAAARIPRRIAHFRATTDERPDTVRRLAYRRLMHALIDRCATDIVGVGQAALAHAWSRDWARDPRCQVAYSGVDPDRFVMADPRPAVAAELGLEVATPLVLHVGRFAHAKNQPRVVEVFAAHAAHGLGHLVFVGRGGTAEEDLTQRRVDAAGLRARVHFLGERADVARLLAAADVMILASRNEGLPGVVLEALAAGTPVVANDLPGVIEIRGHLPGVTVVPDRAPPQAWGEAIAAALAHAPDAAARAAAHARFAASPFALANARQAMLGLWTRPP